MRLAEWVVGSAARLGSAGIENPALDARLIAAHVLGKDRSWVLAHGDDEVPEQFAEGLVALRMERTPLAYVLGHREFYGRKFFVDRSVLVPRQETEHVVEVALRFCDQTPGPVSVVDIGTGSGCIGLTLKAELPSLQVTLADISPPALETACKNRDALGLEAAAVVSDLFSGLPEQSYGVVVSNPPYVALTDAVQDEVRLYEPDVALYAGESGLEIYARLSTEARGKVAHAVVLEIGAGQEQAVVAQFVASGWTHVLTEPDLAGIPRVVAFEP